GYVAKRPTVHPDLTGHGLCGGIGTGLVHMDIATDGGDVQLGGAAGELHVAADAFDLDIGTVGVDADVAADGIQFQFAAGKAVGRDVCADRLDIELDALGYHQLEHGRTHVVVAEQARILF